MASIVIKVVHFCLVFTGLLDIDGVGTFAAFFGYPSHAIFQ